jgi:hypothetical protein
MLLRDRPDAGFRVPVVSRARIVPDDAAAKVDAKLSDALARRDERDRRMAVSVERARADARFAKAMGAAEPGFVAQIDADLSAYKREPGALAGGDFEALRASVRGRAMRAEAAARSRERILRLGRVFDALVAAARATPATFAAHYETATRTVDALGLQPKVQAAFRARLPEIATAALSAIAAMEPERAAELIRHREGPAAASYGIPRAALRVLAKQSDAALDGARFAQEQRAAADATRAFADAEAAIAAAARDEGPETALASWRAEAATIGAAGVRELRRQSDAAAKALARKTAGAATVRELLAQGQTLDPVDQAHVEGVDRVYAAFAATEPPLNTQARNTADVAFARAVRIVPLPVVRRLTGNLRGDDKGAAAAAAHAIAALEATDAALTKRFDWATLGEARRIAAATQAGFAGADAVAQLRAAADVPVGERARRRTTFDREVTGAAIARALERAFGIRIGQPSRHGRA